MKRATLALVGASLVLSSCATVPQPEQFDLIVRGGTVYDGGGGTPFVADVGVRGDRIVAVERRLDGSAKQVIEASGLAVAPGDSVAVPLGPRDVVTAAYPELRQAARAPRIRLGMVGGGRGAFIGAVHRIAARLDDQYELVAGCFSSDAERGAASAAALYRAFMDEVRIEALDDRPLQGGLAAIRAAYVAHVARMLLLGGWAPDEAVAELSAGRVMALEAATSAEERAVALAELSHLFEDNAEVITAPPAPEV